MNTPVAAYSRPSTRSQLPNDGVRVAGESFDVSSTIPSLVNAWSDTTGGRGAGRPTVTLHAPASWFPESVPAAAEIAPAATMANTATRPSTLNNEGFLL